MPAAFGSVVQSARRSRRLSCTYPILRTFGEGGVWFLRGHLHIRRLPRHPRIRASVSHRHRRRRDERLLGDPGRAKTEVGARAADAPIGTLISGRSVCVLRRGGCMGQGLPAVLSQSPGTKFGGVAEERFTAGRRSTGTATSRSTTLCAARRSLRNVAYIDRSFS